MLPRIVSIVSSASLALVAACAAPSEPTGSGADALINGSSTTYPVVELRNRSTGALCSGTSLSDVLVLTATGCRNSNFTPQTFDVCQRSVCATGTVKDRSAYGTIVQLDHPINTGPYPLVSNYPVSDVYPLTCVGTSSRSHVPAQASFAITDVTPTSFFATPTGGAGAEHSDSGGGCFAGNTLYGVLVACDALGCSGTSAAPLIDLVLQNVGTAPFCGAATCGLQQAGTHVISCGTCGDGLTCNAGSCVSLPPPPPPLPGCPRGTKDCGDGTCVPTRTTCQ